MHAHVYSLHPPGQPNRWSFPLRAFPGEDAEGSDLNHALGTEEENQKYFGVLSLHSCCRYAPAITTLFLVTAVIPSFALPLSL